MSRSRFDRPDFDIGELAKASGDEAQNRLLFDWWCDEDDRPEYIKSLHGVPTRIPSRSPLLLDPAPPFDVPAPQGFRNIVLLSDPAHIVAALTDTEQFGNIPYASLGGASFLLAIDPGKVPRPPEPGVDWHAEQQALISVALDYPAACLRDLAKRSVEQAALTSLAASEFDLAQFAEQAALRYLGQLFGYGFQDHGLLEDASRATYRALQYLAVGQHFVTEPTTLPAAQQALGRLAGRSSELMEAYTRLRRAPRRYGFEPTRAWPVGVQPWSELGLTCLGDPVLKRLPTLGSPLSGRDRATIAATLLAGTLGNIGSAVCLVVQGLLNGPDDELGALRQTADDDALETRLEGHLARHPPLSVLPRRTKVPMELNGVEIDADTDCLLLLEGRTRCPHAPGAGGFPDVWGDPVGTHAGAHHCLGDRLARPLIAALIRHVLQLPGLKAQLDALTGETLEVERLWGFACTRYPLRFEREQARVQQNLIVSMRVKAPIAENAPRLRRLVAAAVPRVEHVLGGFGNLHFAWFEFSDDDTHLVLRTIYDGPFEAYIEYFALRAGDLFDGLFEFLEDAPPRPIAEHPQEFVEAIRRANRAPLAGYLFSAYPRTETAQVRRGAGPST